MVYSAKWGGTEWNFNGSVTLGGEDLGDEDITVDENGNITLTPELLERLPDGEYTIQVQYGEDIYEYEVVIEDGVPLISSPTKLFISVPTTNEQATYMTITIYAVIILLGALFFLKKKQK